MKSYIVILFLSIYSFSVFQIDEYIKIPLLLEHYSEHKKLNSKLNFLSFILDHYSHGEVFDKDYDKDMKLPFKSHNCSCNNNPIVTFLSQIQVFNFEPNSTFKDIKKPTFVYNFSFISNFHSSIWQPPKIYLFRIS